MAEITRERLLHLLSPLPEGEFDLWIAERWIEPAEDHGDAPRFDSADVARARLVRDLRIDMALDRIAVGVILDLHDQLSGARRQLETLIRAVEAQDQQTRRAIATQCKHRVTRTG
jgi:chaperone modulatory protein CbpM